MQQWLLKIGWPTPANLPCLKALLISSAFLFGCTNNQLLLHNSTGQSHTAEIGEFKQLPVAMLLPSATEGTILRIYIEGDGRAWITASQPSLDPTPIQTFMRELAVTDSRGAVYLGRPCQYQKNPNCSISLWTQQRFSQQVVSSLSAALDTLKARYQAEQLELIGYSGGATMALLLAAQRTDIYAIQTLAGNLSPKAWVEQHQLSPLTGSLEPTDFAAALQHVPQRHLFGALDKNIPPATYQDFLQRLKIKPKCTEYAVITGATHHSGWTAAWQDWQNKPISCLP